MFKVNKVKINKVNFELISHLFLVFLLLILNRSLFAKIDYLYGIGDK